MFTPSRAARALYALASALLLFGLALGRGDGRNRIPLPLRMLSSALVLLAAQLLAHGQPSRERRMIAVGMSCGTLGDMFMARVIPVPEHVLCGMASFGVGHGLYIGALASKGIRSGPRWHRALRAGLGAGWLVGLLGWWALIRSPRTPPRLTYGGLAYALLLGSMGGTAAALAASDPRQRARAAGAGLFLASDILLAGELFRDLHFPSSGDAVWLIYIAGQMLIVGDEEL
ncbi:MAG TPA: lysoplasmalogenase [Roseiflexaceae bacterium]|nr:lysoplasmalogenase [Roseiflexaceae bacterium]